MIKIEDSLYDFKVAVPLIISLLAFKEHLPQYTLDKLVKKPEKMPFRAVYKESYLQNEYVMKDIPSFKSDGESSPRRKTSYDSDSDILSSNDGSNYRKTLRPSPEELN